MRDKRKNKRYDVSGFPDLRAGTSNGPIGERLITMSEGGCGFWAPSEDFRLKIGELVEIHFVAKEISSEARKLYGQVLYVLPHPIEAQIGRMYGVRFREEDSEKVYEIIHYLDNLLEQGRIKVAL